MNQQPDDNAVVVVGEDEISFLSQLCYGELPSGDSLLIAQDRAWSIEQSEKAAIARTSEILQSFENGQFQKIPLTSILREWYGHITNSGHGTSLSVKVLPGSISCPRWLTDCSASSESSCPSLASDTIHREPSSSANLWMLLCPPTDNSFESATNVAEPSTLLSREEELEPLVLVSIRQVLANSPSYAEAVVLALKKLPDVKRDIVFNQYWVPVNALTNTRSSSDTPTPDTWPHPSGTGIEAWKASRATTAVPTLFVAAKTHSSVSGTNRASTNASVSPRRVPASQSSQAKSARRESGTYRVQKRSGRQSRNRAKLPDEDGENQDNGDDGSGSGRGGGAVPSTDKQRKSDNRWACPYCLAFPHMLGIARFKSCRPPGSLNSRALWKDHLKEYHSPKAKRSNDVGVYALFYMDDMQWKAVQTRIADEPCRPRAYEPWFEVQKKCFLDVWRIIFPRAQFPSLNDPLSPFYPDISSLANLGSQSRILFEAICDVRARRAVSAECIVTVQDFRPTHEEYMEMMEEAFAIVANMSPSASQWVVNASPEELHAAVADQTRDTAGHEIGNTDPEAVTSPESTTKPSPEARRSDDPTASAAMATPIFVPLYPHGTHIYLEVSHNYAADPDQRPALLQVIPPRDFYVDSMRRVPMPLPASTLAPSSGVPASAPTFSRPVDGCDDYCIDPSLIEDAQGEHANGC